MTRFTNTTINAALGELRTSIREGKTTVYFRDQGVSHLKRLVLAALGLYATDEEGFSKENFNPQTVRRFEKLFDVPVYAEIDVYYPDKMQGKRFPTQEETATAIQNFMNRRMDPWAHVRPSTEVLLAGAQVAGI